MPPLAPRPWPGCLESKTVRGSQFIFLGPEVGRTQQKQRPYFLEILPAFQVVPTVVFFERPGTLEVRLSGVPSFVFSSSRSWPNSAETKALLSCNSLSFLGGFRQ